MEKSVIKNIIRTLKSEGIDTYPPNIKKGKCKSPYVVVKNAGSSPFGNYSSQIRYFDFLCYVPSTSYLDLEEFIESVKEILDEKLYPMIMPTGNEQQPYLDDELDAYMISFMYRNNIRNKHL